MINFKNQFSKILEKYKIVENTLNKMDNLSSEDLIKMNREYADLRPIVDKIEQYKKEQIEILNLNELLKDSDQEISKIADVELREKKNVIQNLEDELLKLLIPKDINDTKNSILEIRAGTGGDEASLFASDLLNMYQRYADINNWKFEILSISETGLKGIKEVVCNISGINVFSKLKFESGVHRVQRVPTTESSGRVHTSAATVAVLPEAEEVDVAIEEKDLRIDVFRSSGPGGQSVNTTDSAVRITHLPTKIVVQCQNERSQHKNKETCMNMLKARLYDHEIKKKEREAQSTESSKSEIGWGHQIRSYILQPYRLVKDNRTNFESPNPDKILDGEIDDFLEQSLYQIK